MKKLNSVRASLAALLLALGGAALSQAAVTAPTAPVKWHPGHYVALGASAGEYLTTNTFKEISALPNVRGVMTRYAWRDIETSRGVYDFSRIDRDLNLARAAGKQLFITISTKAFQAGARALPDYLHTAEYGGGVYRIRISGKDATGSEATTGENIALYEPSVRDRLVALARVLGRRYNAQNNFEGIAYNETALGQAVVPLTDAQKNTFFANLAQVDTATRQAFPNTVVMQFLNFPKPNMPGLVSNMLNAGVALGGPDTFLNDSTLEASAYPLYDTVAGKLPLGPSVQAENYVTTYQFGPYAPPAVTDLYAFARGRLHANYLFWSKTLTPPLIPYDNVMKMFKSASFPKDAAGGLNTACPTLFTACVAGL
ncbi:hypothetical protein [Azohydromonas lata]|uniref:Glycoside hydrolase family 42 N-terminal domain-containing protein n=1 Tax=Azohydromonas lata TaxID=45677 RepID=A0ABU5IRM2_9BURK|nr:hypothetical protein [Azohydromonas lata]MDZ5461545.1 hypothetical protein [Azohydromonas lata]